MSLLWLSGDRVLCALCQLADNKLCALPHSLGFVGPSLRHVDLGNNSLLRLPHSLGFLNLEVLVLEGNTVRAENFCAAPEGSHEFAACVARRSAASDCKQRLQSGAPLPTREGAQYVAQQDGALAAIWVDKMIANRSPLLHRWREEMD